MKILYLTPGCFDKGGISRYCRYQISAIREIFGHKSIRVISLLGPTINSFEEKFDVSWAGKGNGIDQKMIFSAIAAKETIEWGPDVIHSAHVNFSGIAYLLSKIGKSKTILNTYGLEVWSGLAWDAAYGLKNMELIISDCYFTANYLKTNLNLSDKKTKVIWDCVDLKKFLPGLPKEDVLWKYKIPSPERFFNIMTLGRLSSGAEHKGYDRLLQAFSKVWPQAKNSRLIIAGSGNMRSKLQNQASRLNIDNMVVFTGAVHDDDLVDVYRSAHVFSLISDRGKDRGEGIPLTPLEAMATGVPILVGNQDGSQEAVVEGRNGFVLDPLNIQQHVHAIMTLISDRELLKRLSIGAADIARENFSYEKFIKKHIDIYKEIY